jgi:hypothetical protein
LNPERVAGENKIKILVRNLKRNKMAFFRISMSYGSRDISILIQEGQTFGGPMKVDFREKKKIVRKKITDSIDRFVL